MPQMTIQLKCDPVTGKKDIIISLSGDEDSLPHEHEQQHRTLVEKLIGGGLLKESELGKVIVQREEESSSGTALPEADEQSEQPSQAEGH